MKSLRYLFRIGPGPSSSHTIGPKRACEYILKLYPNSNKFIVNLYGSLALTGKGHLTDYIIKKTLGENRTIVNFDINKKVLHPNTFEILAYHDNELLINQLFISLGGGALSIDNLEEDIYPFKNFYEIKEYCKKENILLKDFVYRFEDENIKDYLSLIYDKMCESIQNGLTASGELPGGLHVLRKAKSLAVNKDNESSDITRMKKVSSYAYAVSEENASGGTIVTAPTCGSSGVLPAVLYYLQNEKNFSKDEIIDALAVSSIIGNVIKQNASISGAFAGCQAEIGSACSMASAANSYLNGASIDEIEYASEIAMEHHLGLTCDPIKGLVQIPCIERNAVAALRAMDACLLASFLTSSRKISFDTVVETMYQTGLDMGKDYKETSLGGLAKNYHEK